jgi:hypothetical protein
LIALAEVTHASTSRSGMRSLIATRHSRYPPRVSLPLAGLPLRAPRAARADDLPYLDGTESLPGLTTQFVPAIENHCTVGRTRRIDAVIRERRRHLDALAASCDHDSICWPIFAPPSSTGARSRTRPSSRTPR